MFVDILCLLTFNWCVCWYCCIFQRRTFGHSTYTSCIVYHSTLPVLCTTPHFLYCVPHHTSCIMYHSTLPVSCTTPHFLYRVPLHTSCIMYHSTLPVSCTTPHFLYCVPLHTSCIVYHSTLPVLHIPDTEALLSPSRMDLVPFYARLVATLHPLLPDIGSELVILLVKDLKFKVLQT